MGDWIERPEEWIPHQSKQKHRSIVKEAEENQQSKKKQSLQYGVIYHPLRCPRCRSKNIKTYKSEPPIRYHKCRDCGYNFRSREAKEVEKIIAV